MSVKKFLAIVACSVMPSLADFVPDTLLEAGLLSVPCKTIKQDLALNGEKGASVLWLDSIGRTISFNDEENGEDYTRRQRYQVEFDLHGNVSSARLEKSLNNPGGSGSEQQILIGHKWNGTGSISIGIRRTSGVFGAGPYASHYKRDELIELVYDEDSISAIDTIILDSNYFVPDMAIDCGGTLVPVKRELYDKFNSKGGYKLARTIYKDTLNRTVERHYFYHNLGTRVVTHDTLRSRIDVEFNIAEQFYVRDSLCKVEELAAGDTTLSYDTLRLKCHLLGYEWNEKGCITEGMLSRTKMVVNETVEVLSEDSVGVTITYDSTGVYALDTLYHDVVSVVFDDVNFEQNIVQNDRKLCIQGLHAGEVVSLFSASGRLLKPYTVSRTGQLEVHFTTYPPGMYLLSGANLRKKIICR